MFASRAVRNMPAASHACNTKTALPSVVVLMISCSDRCGLWCSFVTIAKQTGSMSLETFATAPECATSSCHVRARGATVNLPGRVAWIEIRRPRFNATCAVRTAEHCFTEPPGICMQSPVSTDEAEWYCVLPHRSADIALCLNTSACPALQWMN